MSLKQVALVKGVCGIDWCSWVIGAFDTFGHRSYCHCCNFPWCWDVWLKQTLVRARGVLVPLLVVAKAMKVVLIFASRPKVGVTEVVVAGASAVTSRALEERRCTVKAATQVVTARMRLTLVEVVVDVHLLVFGVGRFTDGLDPD